MSHSTHKKETPMVTLQDVVNAHKIHGGHRPGARALNIPESSFRRKFDKAMSLGIVAEDMDAAQFTRELKLRDQLAEQKAINRKLAREKVKTALHQKVVDEVAQAKISAPKWTISKSGKTNGEVGTPTLFLSDWHFSEVVFPSQVGGINSYDSAIAKSRLRTTVSNMVDVYLNHLGANKYPGLVLALGGDMFSGDIHAELKETNDSPSLVALFDFAGELKTAITELKGAFGKVFIPCVAGNHGRTTKKPSFKNAAAQNIDWALYRLLAEQFKGDPDVTFYIPDGTDAIYKVYNTVYCLTHGDKLGTGGGGGNVGPFGPIVRGVDKTVRQYQDIGLMVDCVIMGHWHQYTPLQKFIVNGSGKGPDEFSMGMRFKPEAPVQASWLTHPEYGITIQAPIFCSVEGNKIGAGSGGQWVSHFE